LAVGSFIMQIISMIIIFVSLKN